MRSTIIKEGEVSCPHCGAVNSFTCKRTTKAKTALAFMPLLIAAAPKRLQCNGCGRNLKRGPGHEMPLEEQAYAARRATDEKLAVRRAYRESGMSVWQTQRAMHERYGK